MEAACLPASTSRCSWRTLNLIRRAPRPASLLLAPRKQGAAASRTPICSMNVAIGGGSSEYVPKFPRMNEQDPHRRLGVSGDASEEEIREARNFLSEQYAGHESSVESIESAYEKILITSFKERKRTKFNLKSRLRNEAEELPSWVKRLLGRVELPSTGVILRRLFLFSFMGSWSMLNSAETGPAFQVALSLLSCIYFLNAKMQNLARASITGLGALVVGWMAGSALVSILPSIILTPGWTIELLTSLTCYVFLFLACTFIK